MSDAFDASIPPFLCTPGQVVRALEHRSITVGSQTWVVEVFGVHRVGTDLWVQLGRVGNPAQGLILRFAAATPTDVVLATLMEIRPPANGPRVVPVVERRSDQPA